MADNKEIETEYIDTADSDSSEVDIDNNEDMLITPETADDTVSFEPEQPPAPVHGWTKKQMRSVWIIAVVVTVLFVLFSFLFQYVDIWGMLGLTT